MLFRRLNQWVVLLSIGCLLSEFGHLRNDFFRRQLLRDTGLVIHEARSVVAFCTVQFLYLTIGAAIDDGAGEIRTRFVLHIHVHHSLSL